MTVCLFLERICLEKKNPITSMVFHLEQVAEAGALESVLKPRV